MDDFEINPIIWQETFANLSDKAKILYFYLYSASDCQGDSACVGKIMRFIGLENMDELTELKEKGIIHSGSNINTARIFGKYWTWEKEGKCF